MDADNFFKFSSSMPSPKINNLFDKSKLLNASINISNPSIGLKVPIYPKTSSFLIFFEVIILSKSTAFLTTVIFLFF